MIKSDIITKLGIFFVATGLTKLVCYFAYKTEG